MRLKLYEDAIRSRKKADSVKSDATGTDEATSSASRLRMKSPILNPQMRPMKRMPMRKTAAQPSLEFPPERGKA